MPTILHPFHFSRLAGFLLLLGLSVPAVAQFTVDVDSTDALCFGVATGAATATPNGGTAPYTYAWSTGATSQTITNLSVGSYGVTVTDAGGASVTGGTIVNQPPPVTATISEPGQCSAPFAITVNAVGGTQPYRYNWSTGEDSRSIAVDTGSYCVTVVDGNGCGYVSCTTVAENPPAVNLIGVDLLCAGDNSGSVTATGSGGVPPYTYAWSTGAAGQIINGLAAGAYSVTLTDARGCTATAQTSLSEPAPITGQVIGDATVCPGATFSFLRIAPQGGTPPYSYLWSFMNLTTQGVGPVPAGTYSVTVTDANGCSIVRNFTVSESEPIDIEIVGDDLLCGPTTTGTLTAQPLNGPVGQYTYAWNTGVSGPTLTNVTAGTYTVTATDVNGCTGMASFVVRTVDLRATTTASDVACSGDSSGVATVFPTGGTQPYSYQWSTGAQTQTITGLRAGTYAVTVTEAEGCKVDLAVVVNEPTPLDVSVMAGNVSCPGLNDGFVTLSVSGGTQPYAYLWSTGATTPGITDLAAGTYSATVTDANNCTEEITATITQPTPIVINENVVNIACAGDSTGAIITVVTGGSAPYTYRWNTGANTSTISGLTAGVYTVTVTDANNCVATETYTLTEPAPIVGAGVTVNPLCAGSADGSITTNVTGGTGAYSYQWNTGATTPNLSNLGPGTYMVVVTDANDCSETLAFILTSPPAITITPQVTNVTCFGGNDGAIDVTVSGGTQPYTFSWSNGATTADLNNLMAGTYSLSVTDANGCVETLAISVGQPPAIDVRARVTPVACNGDTTGVIISSVSGGTPGYTYAWNTGATGPTIRDLAAGTYALTVTDANGCMATESFVVGTNSPITITGTATDARCNGEASGSVSITAAGGANGGYGYSWSNGATTQNLTGVPAGTYSVTVSDPNECDATATFTVGEPDPIRLTVSAPNISCGGTATGTITVFPAGGTAPYTYAWSNGQTGPVITNLAAGSYTVTVTDDNGCTEVTAGITLNELPQLTCTIVTDQEADTGNNGQLTIVANGGTQPYNYLWSTGATSQTLGGLAAGTYSATVTDANNCTTVCTATLDAFAGIGDFVWEDFNANGQQDPGEPGLADYPVFLKNQAGVIIDSTLTDANGNYAFTGLAPGNYSILFPEPPGGVRTLANTGSDAADSDGDPAMNGMTQLYNLAPGEFNMTVDAGFFAEPNGAITDPCACLNNNTTNLDGQFSEIVEIVANRGQTWTIVARTNMFLDNGVDPPALPVPVPIGTVLTEVPGPINGDPDLSKYIYEFRLVDSLPYSVVLSNGAFELPFSNQCFYPEVRFADNLPDTVCVFDDPIQFDALGFYRNSPLPGFPIFTVDGAPQTSLDPSTVPPGSYVITAEFVADPAVDGATGLEFCQPGAERRLVVIDECPAKLGDFVWQDDNGNGVQDPGEPGIGGLTVTVTSQDGTYQDITMTDANGMYMFMLPPGTYKVTFGQPMNFVPTISNAGGNDALDSDVDPATFMTPFYTVGANEQDFTIDAGFIPPCVDNIDDPGTIGFDQTICGPGNIPQTLVGLTPPVGGSGPIEYLWMFIFDDPTRPINAWTPIPNSNTPDYSPGRISRTTYFARCARRSNCRFVESNTITITVGDDAVAQASGPAAVCVGEQATFTAVNATPGAVISWTFTGLAGTQTFSGPTVTTFWNDFGNYNAVLTVSANGCVSRDEFNVSVVNNPTRCGGNLVATGTLNSLQARAVTVEWSLPNDGTSYVSVLERSLDRQNWTDVGTITNPDYLDGNGRAVYRRSDVSPLAGRTYYRVRLVDAQYADLWSNVVEFQLAPPSSSLGRVFPNPAIDGQVHVELTDLASSADPVKLQLFTVTGQRIGPTRTLRNGEGAVDITTQAQAAGVYFLRLSVGDRTETYRVVLE